MGTKTTATICIQRCGHIRGGDVDIANYSRFHGCGGSASGKNYNFPHAGENVISRLYAKLP